jgi:hypothetical protein
VSQASEPLAGAPARPLRFKPKGQLRLSANEIATACALLSAPGHDLLARPESRAALAGLREAGALDEAGALVDPAASIVRVIAHAELRVELRVWHADQDLVSEHRAWADAEDAVVGDLVEDAIELTRLDWQRLALAMALRLGLCGAVAPTDDTRVAITIAPETLSLVAAGERPGAPATPLDRGVHGDDADVALALAGELRAVWSAASSWREPGGATHTSALSALDGGASGWWALEPGAAAVLEPTDPEELWRRLHDLLPGRAADAAMIATMRELDDLERG